MTEEKTRRFNILVVDDEMVIRDVLEDFLSSEGYNVVSVPDGAEALLELEEDHYDALLSDLMMPSMTGLELIQKVKAAGHRLVTIIMTGYGTIETAVQAMKIGADDYILKPFKMEEVLQVLKRSFLTQSLEQENMNLKETLKVYKVSETIASSENISVVLDHIVRASQEETGADYVYIHLFESLVDPDLNLELYRSEKFRYKFSLDIDKISLLMREQNHVILQNDSVREYVSITDKSLTPVSLLAIPIRISSHVLGFLLTLSFSKKTIFREGNRKYLSVLSTKAASSLENARLIDELQEANRELTEANMAIQENFRQTILAFARAIEQNDPYTRGHSDRVAQYSRFIAEYMELGDQFIDDITFAGQLHDIGKIGISSQKLNKAGKLNAPEIRMFRKHPEMGKRILEPIPFMRHLIPGVYCHHEKYDGSGYPQGLKEYDIPLMGRIIAVADTFDAMTSDRSYRKALSAEVAIDELIRNSGTQFDPDIVEVFLKVVKTRINL